MDRVCAKQYGRLLAVPVLIQLEALRERLNWLAEEISIQRLDGWRPVHTEWALHKELTLKIGGVPLHGRVDVIERNEETGAYRIIDYKTSDTGAKAEKSHIIKHRSNSAAPHFPEMLFRDDNTLYRWGDLQLPLYQLAVFQAFGEWAECAYMNLPKAKTEGVFSLWTPNEVNREAAYS